LAQPAAGIAISTVFEASKYFFYQVIGCKKIGKVNCEGRFTVTNCVTKAVLTKIGWALFKKSDLAKFRVWDNVTSKRKLFLSIVCMHINYQDTQANTTEQLNSTEQQSHSKASRPCSVAEAVVKILGDMGVEYAFGVSGGAIAPMWAALHQSPIQVLHFRHEAGAAFAAIEAHFASDRPVVVFTTTGPGITNALTGLLAARWEGAKVILVSASTSAPQRGRWACQETSTYTMPTAGIFTSGQIFHYATTLESSDELTEVSRRLALGLGQPGGFVAHISIPTNIQTSSLKTSLPRITQSQSLATTSEETIAECVRLLSEGPFAIWVGFGARGAAKEIYRENRGCGNVFTTGQRYFS
jgi:acetolactate synthase I/II/III large subunit